MYRTLLPALCAHDSNLTESSELREHESESILPIHSASSKNITGSMLSEHTLNTS